MIRIINAVKRFDKLEAIANLSIEIDKGLIGLVGQNGAGKSTLFRLISNVEYLDEGEIYIDSFKPGQIEAKKKIFFLPDDPYVPKRSNIAEMLSFYSTFYSVDKEKFWSLIDAFKLPKERKMMTFSKGMRRQAFIALALSSNCEILLLDEAFDGLDPVIMEKIKDELIEVYQNKDRTIIVSTHNIYALEKLVDRFIIIHQGKLQKDDSLEHLGETFEKYQAIFALPCDEKSLKEQGLNVISYRQIGSIVQFVINTKSGVDIHQALAKFQPTLLENIAIDANEIVMLQMLTARKKEQ